MIHTENLKYIHLLRVQISGFGYLSNLKLGSPTILGELAKSSYRNVPISYSLQEMLDPAGLTIVSTTLLVSMSNEPHGIPEATNIHLPIMDNTSPQLQDVCCIPSLKCIFNFWSIFTNH